MDLTLLRVASDATLTQGVLLANGRAFAVTLELPWRNNQPDVSCIPVGTYTCQRVQSPKFGETFEITGVQNRVHILFHKGNTTGDTHGCVLVAEKFTGEAVGESGEAFTELMTLLRGLDHVTLRIVDVTKDV